MMTRFDSSQGDRPKFRVFTEKAYNAQRTRSSEANRTTRDWCIPERLCVIQPDISCTQEDPP
jgi:hypothetical protein